MAPRMRYVFVLGAAHTTETQAAVDQESEKFKDIVQQDFYEAYHNLTIKTIMGLEYAVKYCPNAKFVLKADSDVFVNVPLLMSYVTRKIKAKSFNSIFGHCNVKHSPKRWPKTNKWYVGRDEYNQTAYPQYCQGGKYLLSMTVAAGLVRVAPDTPFHKLEDTWIGLAMSLTTFKNKHENLFRFTNYNFNAMQPLSVPCNSVLRTLTTHKTKMSAMKLVWDKCYKDKWLYNNKPKLPPAGVIEMDNDGVIDSNNNDTIPLLS